MSPEPLAIPGRLGAAFAAALLLLVASPAATAQSLAWEMRTEAGYFNRGFQNREYVTSTRTSFGTPYFAVGGEVEQKDAEGNSWSLGLAQTSVSPGRAYNWDRWEVQPLTLINFAGLSVGKDYGWTAAGLGVGAIVQLRDFEANDLLEGDGQPGPGSESGLDWNRRESFTVLTGLFRLFPEDQPHLKLRIARGPLSLAENLMHLQMVWPSEGSRWDAEIGFSSPLGLVFHGEGVLRSNERLSVGWALGGAGGRVGVRAGFLLRTLMEGSGEVDVLRRLSFAVEWAQGSTLPAAR